MRARLRTRSKYARAPTFLAKTRLALVFFLGGGDVGAKRARASLSGAERARAWLQLLITCVCEFKARLQTRAPLASDARC